MFDTIRTRIAHRVPNASFSFLGLGVIQGWLVALQTIVQSGIQTDIPTAFGRVTLFADLGSVPVFLVFALFVRRFAPLERRRAPLFLGLVCVYLASGLAYLAPLSKTCPQELGLLGLAFAGSGSCILMLYWWELYSMLNPIEVALYCAGSWIVRDITMLALAGYEGIYLLAATALLPVISLCMLDNARRKARQSSSPIRVAQGTASFPWKPLTLIALYAFAYGCGTWLLHYRDNHFMHLGILLPTCIVCASVLFSTKRFNFALVYRIILPAATAFLLAILVMPGGSEGLTTIFVRASYTSVFIYVSILLCNLSRRYSISAVWLFSLFNLTHIAFLGFGTLLFDILPSPIILGLCIVCILFSTFIIVSEPTLDSNWRIVLTRTGGGLAEHARLQLIADSLAQKHDLSNRQAEILLLLAQGNLPRTISNKLTISPGTVKAHVQRIYKKLGIHSKDELDALFKE